MMRKITKKIFIIPIILIISILSGCAFGLDEKADDVVQLLEKKYGEKFTPTWVREREKIQIWAHPEGEENLVFTAVMREDGTLQGDGYVTTRISRKFNDLLKRELSKSGIESETITYSMGSNSFIETNSHISIKEFVEKYKPEYFSAHMIVKESPNFNMEAIEKAAKVAYAEGLNTTFQLSNLRIMSEKDYEKFAKDYIVHEDGDNGDFAGYDVLKRYEAVVDANGFHYHDVSKVY